MATVGPLLFGSTDPSVVAQFDMRSAPTAADNLGGTVQIGGTAPTYDPYLGCLFNTSGYFRWNLPADIAALNLEGQISFEIETRFLAINNVAASGSIGDALGSVMAMFGIQNSAGSAVMRYRKAASAGGGQTLFVRNASAVEVAVQTAAVKALSAGSYPTGVVPNIHSQAHGQFVRVTIDWKVVDTDRIVTLAFDNVVCFRQAIPYLDWGTNTGSFRFVIGADAAGANPLGAYYMRNFIIGNESINWSQTGKIGKVCLWGDSTSGNPELGSPRYTGSDWYAVLRRLAENGYYYDPYTDYVSAFYTGYTSSALEVTQADVIAESPVRVAFIAGTNDCSAGTAAATFATSVQSNLTAIAEAPSVRSIVLLNVRSVAADTTAAVGFVSNRDGYVNPILADTQWDTNSKPLAKIDAYSLLNRDVMAPCMYVGWLTGDLTSAPKNNLHPAAYGSVVEGRAIADAFIEQSGSGSGAGGGLISGMITGLIT